MAEAVKAAAPENVLDFGCGEGYSIDMMAARGVDLPNYLGLDLRQEALHAARKRQPQARFECANLFDAKFDDQRFHTVMALEVLEHLFEPEKALERLVSLATDNIILTVPNEPWFQMANLVRGRDLIRLGNHPEHINHWNKKTFRAMVEKYADVSEVQTRFPFVILTAKPR